MHVIPLGGAGTVTGSRFLLVSGRTRILVDCGLFQGLKVLRQRNWNPFPVPPEEIDAVVLTHAHLDHSGFLPVLVREGFAGKIHLTPPTAGLLPILLEDAGRLQEEDALWANRKGFSRHSPARPLFTEADARRVTPRLRTHAFDEDWTLGKLRFRFHRAGHILGAASLVAGSDNGRTVLFSGDLGRRADPLLPPPAPRPDADLILMEATYGDRSHTDESAEDALATATREAFDRGGVVMIASFAVGRAQTLALLVHRLMLSGRLPEVPVFLNSPMAIEVTRVHLDHVEELRPGADEVLAAMDRLVPTPSVEESREINRRRGPMIIIAGAGMLTGGRILHHLLAFGGDRRNALILPGFQAEGTRGRHLRSGARTIRIHGDEVEINCKVTVMDQLSGHADDGELVEWATSGVPPREGVAIVHAEPAPADIFRRTLEDATGWKKIAVAEEGRSYP